MPYDLTVAVMQGGSDNTWEILGSGAVIGECVVLTSRHVVTVDDSGLPLIHIGVQLQFMDNPVFYLDPIRQSLGLELLEEAAQQVSIELLPTSLARRSLTCHNPPTR